MNLFLFFCISCEHFTRIKHKDLFYSQNGRSVRGLVILHLLSGSREWVERAAWIPNFHSCSPATFFPQKDSTSQRSGDLQKHLRKLETKYSVTWVSWRHLVVKLQQIPREVPGLEKLVQRNCSSEEYLDYPVKMAIINRKRIPPTIRSVRSFFSTYGMPAFHFRVTPITSALKAQIKHTGNVWQHLSILSEKANCLLRALPIFSLLLSYMFPSWNKFWENHSSFLKHMVQADREGNNWKLVRQPNPSLVNNLPALPCPCAPQTNSLVSWNPSHTVLILCPPSSSLIFTWPPPVFPTHFPTVQGFPGFPIRLSLS